jgi:hypothetical protein
MIGQHPRPARRPCGDLERLRGGLVSSTNGQKNKDLRERCAGYIAKTRSLPEAQELARKDGFSANFSVWLSAAAESLKRGKKPWKSYEITK